MTSGYILLVILLVFLVFLSIFFSASETSLMSLNRYRVRHLAQKNHVGAKRVMSLLSRLDRLLGVILIGNTVANMFAAAAATVILSNFYGEFGIAIGTLIFTLFILIFGEMAPKTLAALHPEAVAWPASVVLKFLLKIFYPVVWLITGVANGLLRLFGVRLDSSRLESLSLDELRSLLIETKGKISPNYQQMLLRILDLEQVTIEDIMVPRNDIFGIDFNADWEEILRLLIQCPYASAPLYKDDVNHTIGMLNLRKILINIQQKPINKEMLIDLVEEPYFVPKDAIVNQQLLNFRDQDQVIGLVVDEYGDIQGLITLQDILEEIVGEFTKDVKISNWVVPQKDQSVIVNASIDIRDLNEMTQWKLPVGGPRTLSGLVIEYLEMIPSPGICTRIAGYPMEVIRVSHNTIKSIRVFPQFYKELLPREDE